MKLSRYLLNIKSRNGRTIWYHSISRAVLYLPVKYSADPASALGSLGSREYAELRHMMFLFPDDFDEDLFYRYWYKSLQYSTTMLSFTVHTTLDCNLSCGYCYEKSLSRRMPMADPAAVAEWMAGMVASRRARHIDIGYIGGEPLLNVRAIETIGRRMRATGLPVSSMVITNGTLLTPAVVKRLGKLGINKYQVTLDGEAGKHDKLRPFPDGKGSYALIMDNLARVRDLCEIYINVNLSKENERSIERLLAAARRRALNAKFMFSVVFEEQKGCLGDGIALEKGSVAWLKSHRKAMAEGNKFRPFYRNSYGPCTLYRENYFVVAPDGALYKCSAAVGNEKYKIGCISDSESYIVKARTAQFLESEHALPACSSCGFRPNCDSGCSYQADLAGKRSCNKRDFADNDLPLIADFAEGLEK